MATSLKANGARVVLLNATVQDMAMDLSVYERIAVRERRSAEFVRRSYGGPVTVIPDLAFCVAPTMAPAASARHRKGLLFMDSVSARHARELEALAGEHGESLLRLREWKAGVDALLALVARKELVVTGRFHGAVFAMLTATPLLAYRRNSWKTEGLMADFGLTGSFCRNLAALRPALAARRGGVVQPSQIADVRARWRSFFQSLATAPGPPI